MKAKYLCLLVVLFVFSGCQSNSTGQQVNQQTNQQVNQQEKEMDDRADKQDADVKCESPSEYACHPVYPGPDDTEDMPSAVCGCTPRCESGTFLQVGVGEGNNPDGTRKGVFSCK